MAQVDYILCNKKNYLHLEIVGMSDDAHAVLVISNLFHDDELFIMELTNANKHYFKIINNMLCMDTHMVFSNQYHYHFLYKLSDLLEIGAK